MAASFWQQLKTLMWRNYLLKRKNKKQLSQEILFPVYFVLILAMIKIITKSHTFPAIKFYRNSLSNSRFHFNTSKKLLVSPDSAYVQTLMSVISSILENVQYENFSSLTEAEDRYKADPTDVAAGIVFNFTGTETSYAIRMPYGSLPSVGDMFTLVKNQGDCRRSDLGTESGPTCRANMYLTSGFVWLQNAIDAALIKTFNSSFPVPSVQVQLMPKVEYTPNISIFQMISSVYFVMAYSILINFLCISLVAEKEKKIREGMKMMGLRDSAWWLSWTLVYMLIIFVVTVIMILIVMITSFFPNSNLLIVFMMLYLYGMSIISMAFLLTPFFRKAQVAGNVASFSTIIISLLYLAVTFTRTPTSTGYDYSIPPAGRWGLCLLSPVALALAMDQGIFLDIASGGMSFSTMTLGDFPLFAPILMLLVDSFIYFLLAVYFDHVIPGEYGPRYKPWFCLMPSYWFGKKKPTELPSLINGYQRASQIDSDNLEPVPAELASKAGLRIFNISKEFQSRKNTVKAVNELSLDIYEGQITALLGHNGAGKTTLINMLCGLSPPSSGTATIKGLDVSDSADMVRIRAMTGVCPQHNILYDELSCEEHLLIFAGIKGVRDADKARLVEKAMRDADIAHQANVVSKNLSGGQKRKLSVAIALIGDPKILFLDEPTAGMDPYSRRHLWSLLKKSKEGKIILLTTHFMDEADILADRKAIISHGKLKCCGSSLFLKNRFGIGYHLNMVVDPDCIVDRVLDLLRQHVSGVQLMRSHAQELSFIMPLTEVHKFPEMFSKLESSTESLGIRSYGVSMTSLEEVFLKIGEDEDQEDISGFVNPADNQRDENTAHTTPTHTQPSSGNQVNITIQQATIQQATDQPTTIHQATDQPTTIHQATDQPTTIHQATDQPTTIHQATDQQTTIHQATDQQTTDQPTTIHQATDQQDTDQPTTIHQDTDQQDTDQQATYNSMLSHLNTHIKDGSLTAQRFWALLRIRFLLRIRSKIAFFFQTLLPVAMVVAGCVLSKLNTSVDTSKPAPLTIKPFYVDPNTAHLLVVGSRGTSLLDSFVEGLKKVYVNAVDQVNPTVSLTSLPKHWMGLEMFVIMPIPAFSTGGAICALVLLFFSFIMANLLFAYVCSFAFDKYETCQAFLPNVFLVIGMFPYMAIALMDMFGMSDIAEILHYVFTVIDPPYIIFGGIYYIDRVSRIDRILQQSTSFESYFKWSSNILITIIMPLVHIVLLYLLLRILDINSTGGDVCEGLKCGHMKVHDIPEENADIIDDEDVDVAEERNRVANLSDVADKAQITVSYVQNLRKEFKKYGKISGMFYFWKANKAKVVVRNATFAVDVGEVFGLLGPNGAGKTTTLNMIIAETVATRGKVIVAGHNVHSSMSEAFQALGYCPQHDALWDSITLKEHLECYAAIKGVPKEDIESVVGYYIDNLKLLEHEKKGAKKLSGGTRRKVSFVISMLGAPEIVLLDEPSTGMDPQSKRFFWDTVSSSFQLTGRGAILTTHSMEEADALCSRVAIMVNGQIQCLGPTQHLKDKFGSGYVLEVKLKNTGGDLDEQMNKLEGHLATIFPQIVRLERFAERGQYKIPKTDVNLLSRSFSALESMKNSHNIEEYSFNQSTLEQIFLDFAKKQYTEDTNDLDNTNTTDLINASRTVRQPL
ncbi:cholesterol transporter ABCA5-like [Gigantopelta aegis]|uniref:cholesterol transporter ABCA5-like n=1 Tax=Gigantopelta aegis TaxID=1735272 RepID=UPI001B88DD00|nr:cholesterol transporter ABCA5-like [Gigantopelta aegis]